MTSPGSMEGRVAVVTGASRGIGRSIAERFAGEGAAVAVVARTLSAGSSPLPGSIEEVVDGIRQAGGTAVAVPADLSSPADVETIVQRAEALVRTGDGHLRRGSEFGPRRASPAQRPRRIGAR